MPIFDAFMFVQLFLMQFHSIQIVLLIAIIIVVFDVYIDKKKVWLVDFNPFGRRTASLLFDWEDIFAIHLLLQQKFDQNSEFYSTLREGEESEFMDFKLVDQQSSSHATLYGFPFDGLAVNTPEGIEQLIRLQQEQERNGL